MRASGVMPSCLALSSDMMTRAAAPSFSGQALPAVTVPSGRKTGCSSASFSSVVPGARALVGLQTVPSGRVIGVISRFQKPAAAACFVELL